MNGPSGGNGPNNNRSFDISQYMQQPAPSQTPASTSNLMYSSGFQPQYGSPTGGVQGAQQGNMFQQSAGAYGAGTQALQSVANPFAMQQTMNQFVNPYRESVINNALTRSRQERSQDLNMVRGQAAQAGAYGGARQGLVESELMSDYSQNENEMLARMLQQGFDTRSNLALNTLNQRAGAGSSLVNSAQTGMGLGQSATQMQQQAGGQQQMLLQRILSQAAGQTDTMTNYPIQALNTALAGVQGNPLSGNVTGRESYQPGMFDYLSFGAGLMGGGK